MRINSSKNDPDKTVERAALYQILHRQFSRYPLLEARDLYKLIYQAALGSEHAISDLPAVRTWLYNEIKGLAHGPTEPVIDPISPDGKIVRVNLRPYLAAGGDAEVLLKAFICTANDYRGTIGLLQRYWNYAVELVDQPKFPLLDTTLTDFFETMCVQGFPPVHHSTVYTQNYHPAYRVILQAHLEENQH